MKNKGFTLIELMLGLTMAVTIFIIATNLLISLLSTTTKGRRAEEISQTKNDIETDIRTNARWAKQISYQGGVLKLDANEYEIVDGRLLKNGSPLSNETVIVENLQVTKQTVVTPVTSPGAGHGLIGKYYNGRNFDTLVETHLDFEIDFNWGRGKPSNQLGVDRYSIQWSGQVEIPQSGRYTFYTLSDDGVRLWINNVQIINNWTDHGKVENRASSDYEGGKLYDIRLEYYESTADSLISLLWSGPGIAKQIVPSKYLHEVSAQSSLQIDFDLLHREASTVHDAVSLFVSPREGVIENIDPTPVSPSPTAQPTIQPSGSSQSTATPTPTVPSSIKPSTPTAIPTPRPPTPPPSPTAKPLP